MENNTLYKSCDICKHQGVFVNKRHSIREGFVCDNCGASLRYQEQFSMIKNSFGLSFNDSIKEFVKFAKKNKLCIYEPGLIGPFRKYFKQLKYYNQSYFWEGIAIGDYKDGVQCQNLENLTYPSNGFDLVITSDIFEHIRKPYTAFKEIHRVLKPGGMHIFTIPIQWPPNGKTTKRIDVSGEDDIDLLPKRYHGSPTDSEGAIVYHDFDFDLLDKLDDMGFITKFSGISYNLTFCSTKCLKNGKKDN